MSQQKKGSDKGVDDDPASLSVENIGGIGECTVEFTPGVTLLTGRNATNRTSLLRALNGVLGGTAATLKSDTDGGQVTLTLGDKKYTRTYTRTHTDVETGGEPYTDDDTLIDLFVTLLEDNPARRAVEHGDDLHDIIMRPVDTGAIERRIRDLQQEKQEVEAELDRVEKRRDKLPHLEEQRRELEDELAEIDDNLSELRDEVADVEADADAAEEAEALVDELDSHRQELSRTEDEHEVVKAELNALRDDQEKLQAEREEIAEKTVGNPIDVEDELESLRQQKRRLDDTIASLITIVEFNEDVLSEERHDLPGIDPNDEAVTAELAPDEAQEIVCWTCGSRVNRSAIDERLDDLQAVIDEKRGARSDLDNRIETLNEQRQALKQQQQRRQELDREIETTEEKITQRERKLDEIETEISALRNQIQDLETQVAETEALRESDLGEKYERLSDLQYERGQLEQQLENVNEKISDIETLPDPSDLEAQRDELTDELDRERNRIADLEEQSVEAFNEHMEQILNILEYENLARVWIERKQKEQRRGSPETVFDLHIVREDESGTVYEDIVEHLSESEREVVGLVVALAGYLAHDAYEVVPFMLLDSLEAIDADRIADIVTYFSEYAPYLVVALLPEDATALSDEYNRITADALAA